jgi:hypothetical protein
MSKKIKIKNQMQKATSKGVEKQSVCGKHEKTRNKKSTVSIAAL